MDSILNSIKKLLGITEEYTHFDTDIIIHINTAFLTLTQLGVGPEEGFSIIDESIEWSDFTNDNKMLEAVKTYVYMKVRLAFDPPTTGSLMDALNRQINELEWRLNVVADK